MVSLKLPQFKKSGDTDVDDDRLALKGLIEALNAGTLRLDSLPFITLPFYRADWARGGASTFARLFVAQHKMILRRAVWVLDTSIAANAVNYRSFAFSRIHNAATNAVCASRDTTVASLTADVPFDLTLAAQTSDRTFEKDDIGIVGITGGGAPPDANSGAITLYFERLG